MSAELPATAAGAATADLDLAARRIGLVASRNEAAQAAAKLLRRRYH